MNKQTQKDLLRLVQENYEKIADQFDETRNKFIWPELLNIAQSVEAGNRILDVGCGNGRLLKAFENKKIEYLGADNSENLIKRARSKFPNNKFAKADILELSKLPEINFDYVFCIAVLQHLPGSKLRIQALRQLRNKVKIQGKVIVSVWNMWEQKKIKKLIWKFLLLKLIGKNKMDFGDVLFDWKDSAGANVSQRYYHAFNIIELKIICRKAGFRIENLYKDNFNYYAILVK